MRLVSSWVTLLLILSQGCAQKGCTDHQKLDGHVRPYIVVSKPTPYSNSNNCAVTLRDKNGDMFTLEEWDVACGIANNYAVGDTLR